MLAYRASSPHVSLSAERPLPSASPPDGLEAAFEARGAEKPAARGRSPTLWPLLTHPPQEAAGWVAAHGAGCDDDTRLALYSLYKQATEGPCRRSAAPLFDLVAFAKWQRWRELGEMSEEQAKSRYVLLAAAVGREGASRPSAPVRFGPVQSTLAAPGGESAPVDTAVDVLSAARAGDVAQLVSLLRSGRTPDVCDGDGVTALMHAADRGDLACLEALLEHRADIHAADRDGATALDYARECGFPDCESRLEAMQREAGPHCEPA